MGGKIDAKAADAILREKGKRYDGRGEDHYNTISAFIKTLRGSDPDAALIWLFKMLQAGEDPRFLFRRMAIFASEDIGNADPEALHIVASAWNVFERVGLPEAEYFFAHACIYLAQAPKSNAITVAMAKAKAALKAAPTLEVPNHLRNAPLKGMKEQGYSEGYQYPHHNPHAVVTANYFPLGMLPHVLYEPSDRGAEKEIKERLEKTRKILRGA
jgi:putative ATPase